MTALLAWARLNWKLVLTGLGFLILGFMLLHARADAHHWHKIADAEKTAHAQTVASYRAAAVQADLADKANVLRVKDEQAAITERVSNDYQADLAAARARADALRVQLAASTHSSGPAATPVPATSTAAGRSDGAPAQDGFSVSDRLIATEQAIQLKALQDWVRAQAEVNVGGDNER